MEKLYCGNWDFRGECVGVHAFTREDGEKWENKGVYGSHAGQSILSFSGSRLYSVCERGQGGKIVSYAIRQDGSLEEKDVLTVESAKLSYISCTGDGRYLFVSSMGDGTVRMVRADEDGKLEMTDEVWLSGHGFTPRQDHAKVHSVVLSPDEKYLAAANLGADEVDIFRIDRRKEKLILCDAAPVAAGHMPRHMAFRPDGCYLYVLTEEGNRLYVFSVTDGKLRTEASYETREATGEQKSQPADIVVTRDGQIIYTTNRGQNNIAAWRVGASGLLDRIGYFSCGGEGPRGLCLSQDEREIFVACFDSGEVTVLERDEVTGRIGGLKQKLAMPKAGCVRYCFD